MVALADHIRRELRLPKDDDDTEEEITAAAGSEPAQSGEEEETSILIGDGVLALTQKGPVLIENDGYYIRIEKKDRAEDETDGEQLDTDGIIITAQALAEARRRGGAVHCSTSGYHVTISARKQVDMQSPPSQEGPAPFHNGKVVRIIPPSPPVLLSDLQQELHNTHNDDARRKRRPPSPLDKKREKRRKRRQ